MEVTTTNDVKVRELYFTDEFFPRVTERLQIMLNCIANKTEILDSDYEILQEVHKWFMDGKFGWSKPLIAVEVTKPAQIGLFDTANSETTDNVTNFDDARDKILDGTTIDTSSLETNKTE